MNAPLITTRDTNKASKLSAVISGILDVIFAIMFISFFKDQDLEEVAGLIVLCVAVLGGLVIYTAYQFSICRSYVDVYEDRLEGKGIQNGYQLTDFTLSYDKITNVSCSGINVLIHTSGGNYKILTNAETSKKVYEYCARVRQ